MKGIIHSIDTFSTLDGPGIRTIIFMQGCHLRCKYCHNPDAWKIGAKTAQEYTPQELMPVIRRGLPYFKASGGGITFSGGEPLLQHEFVHQVFLRCQAESISTAFDSSLYVASSIVEKLLPYTDLVLADIKQIKEEKSRTLTGAGNVLNLANLKLINQYGTPIWIRYVVVPGYTDAQDDIEETARFIKNLDRVERIDLLPYHSLGKHKWDILGLTYELQGINPPTTVSLKRLQNIITSISGKPVYL